jgi:hypothetical protein
MKRAGVHAARDTVHILVTGGMPIPDELSVSSIEMRYPHQTVLVAKGVNWIIRGNIDMTKNFAFDAGKRKQRDEGVA